MYKNKGIGGYILDLGVVENWNMKWIISIQIPDSPPSRLPGCISFLTSFMLFSNQHHSPKKPTHNAPALKVLRRYLCPYMKQMHFSWVSMYLAKSANQGHYFYVSNWRRDRNFTWSSESCEGRAVCRKKAVTSFWFWSGPGIRIRDLPPCSQALYRLS